MNRISTRTAVAVAGLAWLALTTSLQSQQPPATQPLAATQPPAAAPAAPATPARPTNSVYLVVRVPANALLEVEGSRTQSTGEVRYLVSPPLAPGKNYVYRLKATWQEQGKQKVVTKDVSVQAGKEVEVDLRREPTAEATDQAPSTPPVTKKDETPKPQSPVVKKDDKPAASAVTKKDEKPPADEPPKLTVPYVPTPQEVVDKMLELAEVKKGDVVYDLGCGDGRIVVTAAKKYGAKGFGVDLDPARVKDSLENVKNANVEDLVQIRKGDVLKTDISPATVVTLYLLPEVNLQLLPILKKQLKPGTRIVSHDFDMGDWQPLKKVDVTDKDGGEHTLYLWKIEGGKK